MMCIAWYSLDVLFTSSTICHLCMISVDRYMSLTYPLRYGHSKKTKHFVARIALVWVISACIAGPLFLLSMIDHPDSADVYKGCGPETPVFVISATVASFYLPLAIMAVMYVLTVRALHRQRKGHAHIALTTSVSSHRGEDAASGVHSPSPWSSPEITRRSPRTPPISIRVTSCAPLQMTETVAILVDSSESESKNNNLLSTSMLTVPFDRRFGSAQLMKRDLSLSVSNVSLRGGDDDMMMMSSTPSTYQCRSPSDNESYSFKSSTKNGKGRLLYSGSVNGSNLRRSQRFLGSHQSVNTTDSGGEGTGGGKSRRLRRRQDNRDSASSLAYKGRKAVQVLGILFAAFVMFYLPFFAAYLIRGTCSACRDYVSPTMITAFEWLAYSGSMVNPIIYHMFNPDFRRAFQHLLRCHRRR